MRSSSSAPWRVCWGAGVCGGLLLRWRRAAQPARGGGEPRPTSSPARSCFTPRLFAEAPAGAYSLNRHYDEAMLAGRLFGIVHRGHMLHVGSPEGLAAAEAHLGGREGG